MKKLVLKMCVLALVAAVPGAAFAAANFPANTSVKFAKELVLPVGGQTLTNAAGSLDIKVNLGYNMSQGDVRFARIECSDNMTFSSVGAVVSSGADAIGAINGVGTRAISFSVTASGVANINPLLDTTGAKDTDTMTVSGDRAVTNYADVVCTYALYDQASQAANGGIVGLINQSVDPNNIYITFAKSYEMIVTKAADDAISDVGATVAFTDFEPVAGLVTSINEANLGTVDYKLIPGNLKINGTAIALADMMGVTTALEFTGDFSAAATGLPAAPYDPATLFLSFNADCSTSDVPATVMSATKAFIYTGAVPTTLNQNVCYQPIGTTPIVASEYSVALDAVTADPALYNVTDIAAADLSSIVRNGTVLKVPYSAFVGSGVGTFVNLLNTGGSAAKYTTACYNSTVQNVDGDEGTIGAGLTKRIFWGTLCPPAANATAAVITLEVKSGNVVGTLVRQNATTGQSAFDSMTGNQ